MNSNNGWLGHLKTWSGPAALVLVIAALVLGVVGLSQPAPADPGLSWAAEGQACGVYMEQGCMQLTAQSGGEIQMESGSTLDIQSGTTATFGGDLTVSGSLAANGGITVDTSNFTVSGTTGAVSTASNLTVGGTAKVTGATTVTGTLTAVGGVAFDSGGTLGIAGGGSQVEITVPATGTVELTRGTVNIGSGAISSQLLMNDTTLYLDTAQYAYLAGSLGTVNFILPTTGTLNLGPGNLQVCEAPCGTSPNYTADGNDAFVAGFLEVSGNAYVDTDLHVAGNSIVTGALTVADITASDDVTITDRISIGGTAAVTGLSTLTGGFSAGGAGSMNENRVVWDLGVTAYTFGSAGYITMTVPATGTVTLENGDLDVDGYAAFSVEPTIVTTDTVLTAAMKGDWQVLQNSGALTVTLTLPDAAAGLQYCVFNYDGDDVMVDPQAADQIYSLTNAAGDRILNTTAGNSVCLLAIDGTYWIAIYPVGTWSDAD